MVFKTPKKSIMLCFFIFSFFEAAFSQMPGWVLMKDRDGNSYYMDNNGKIWTSGKPEFNYKPVTVDGIEYYLHQGIDLINSHYKAEGLIILKSIMAMPPDDKRIYDAQVKALKRIDSLKKKEGGRYKNIDVKASIQLYRIGDTVILMNDFMQYTLKFPSGIELISSKTRLKHNYSYSGVLVGVNLDTAGRKKNAGKYDALVAIDSEEFASELKSAEQFEAHMNNNLAENAFEKRALDLKDTVRVYYFDVKTKPAYRGYDGYYIKVNRGYHVRAIFGGDLSGGDMDRILKIVSGFK
jgi:hypothetical protein